MLTDEAHATIKAGNGGNGIVHFFHDRWRPKGGPDGGNGGKGGSVYFEAVSDITLLDQFRAPRVFKAEDGDPGGVNQSSGKNGQDLLIRVPVGTVVTYDNGTEIEFNEIGEKKLMAKGGNGGQGNYHFRSSINQAPEIATKGQQTEPKRLFLQLKLIAQIGLVGLPNAGKSSLLNELTSAKAKVANYQFTTLEPNLGVTPWSTVIADIPGLIEGASEGKGLGYKFLKHVERTSLLVHCLAADSADPVKDYQTIRDELANYSTNLLEKKEILIITKSDLLTADQKVNLEKLLKPKLFVSIIDDQSLKELSTLLSKQVLK
ncbi:MAG TPA: GTPase ObgE [Patescibacteria group bacterium]